jgi:NTP pyrophosphatase (non-canonical NTP hydrolase)
MSDAMQYKFEDYVRNNWTIGNPGCSPYEHLKSIAIMGLGAGGETGEVQEHVKKLIRDYDCDVLSYVHDRHEKVLHELGDAMHYLTKVTQLFGFTIDEVLQANIDKLNDRYGRRPL